MAVRFTESQVKALRWLPEDGSWRGRPARMSSGLESLWFHHRSLVERVWQDQDGIKDGSFRWRLTERGVAFVKEMRQRQGYPKVEKQDE